MAVKLGLELRLEVNLGLELGSVKVSEWKTHDEEEFEAFRVRIRVSSGYA